MYFDINKYAGKYVMHCKTAKEAKSFHSHLHALGKTWSSGESYLYCSRWETFRKDVAYNFNQGTWDTVSFYVHNDYTILEWEDFMKDTFTKADLKTGDVIQCKGGLVGIVIRELDTIVTQGSYLDMANYEQNLTSRFGNENYDIVAVRRPKKKGDCQLLAFKYQWGDLIYERPKVVEMTLAEVCKLLGKEIKIVK